MLLQVVLSDIGLLIQQYPLLECSAGRFRITAVICR
jgi:hypothetical protein